MTSEYLTSLQMLSGHIQFGHMQFVRITQNDVQIITQPKLSFWMPYNFETLTNCTAYDHSAYDHSNTVGILQITKQ